MLKRCIAYIVSLCSRVLNRKKNKKKELDCQNGESSPPDSIYPLW